MFPITKKNGKVEVLGHVFLVGVHIGNTHSCLLMSHTLVHT
jgi:hypothetical protein